MGASPDLNPDVVLEEKAKWVRVETLRVHKMVPEAQVALSLSAVEILTALYYGKVLHFDQDRFVISKGLGAIAVYPILGDLGRVCHHGHGLGVAAGMAFALQRQGSESQVFVLMGGGELNEGSIWEAAIFASHHRLDNLNLIVEQNQKCVLDLTVNVPSLDPVDEKFRAFGFDAITADGHDVLSMRDSLLEMKTSRGGHPKVLIAETTGLNG